MALFNALRTLYNGGKMALSAAVNGAKTVLPYIKSALPIVSKIANGLQYIPIIGTAAKYIGTASDYLNNNIGIAESLLGKAEAFSGHLGTIESTIGGAIGQKNTTNTNAQAEAIAKMHVPSTIQTQFEAPPLSADPMRQYQSVF